MVKNFVFRFDLTKRNYDFTITKIIEILAGPLISDPKEDYEYVIEKIYQELENRQLESKYGVHDYFTNGEQELIGFNTYEVEQAKIDELMKIWREILVKVGFTLGEERTHESEIKGDDDFASVTLDKRVLEEFRGVKEGKTAFERACEWAEGISKLGCVLAKSKR